MVSSCVQKNWFQTWPNDAALPPVAFSGWALKPVMQNKKVCQKLVDKGWILKEK